MVEQKGKKPGSRKRWNIFYLNGELHKTLQTRRSDDLLVAWNYKQNKRVAYVLADAYRRRQRAYSIGQVAKIFNRTPKTIRLHMRKGDIRFPQKAILNDSGLYRYYFSEDDIRDIHDMFRATHRGRPRKDGEITTSGIVSRAELEALLRNEVVLYTKDEDGEFRPIWKQPEW